MSRRKIIVVGLSLAAGVFPPAVRTLADPAIDASPPQQASDADLFDKPAEGPLVAAVDAAIAKLGSPAFAEREAASRRLIAVGNAALGPLRDAYRVSADFESRLRIEEIARDVYLDHHVFGRNAFLGIRQYQYGRTHEDDERIDEGHYGIELMSVLPDTAAFDAGLEEGDVIAAMDGEPFSATGPMGIAFGDLLRARGPGALVTLSVLRGPEAFELNAVLGTRPRRYYGPGQGEVYEMLSRREAAFEDWWEENFASPHRNGPAKAAADDTTTP